MKFKQVLAGLLVGAMVVTSAPVSGLGALSALAADEGGSTETKSYTYTKLTEGLTASADCGNGNETPAVIVDGKEDNYWHSAYEGDVNTQPERHAEVQMTANNNITLTLSEASTVKKLEYVSKGENENGTITKCNIYYKTSAENAEFQKVQKDPYTLSFTAANATIEFETALNDVKEIKIEVLNTAGNPSDMFISGKELYIYSDDSTKVDSNKISAKAECSSQKGRGLKNLVDNNEGSIYHSSWYGSTGNVEEGEEFDAVVRPVANTLSTELVSRNNLYINLAESKTVGKLIYVPRQGAGDGVANGRITFANIYVSNSDAAEVSAITDWKPVATADWKNDANKKEAIFSPQMAKHIRIEVKHSVGSTEDKFISAAEVEVYEATEASTEDEAIKAPVLTAVAPVKGAKPADVTPTAAEGYTVETAWTDSGNAAVTTFEAGKDYTLTATLTAKEGYKFTEDSKPSKIKVGEGNVDVMADIKDAGKTMTLTHKFTVPAETPAEEYTALPASALTGTADSVETSGESGGTQGKAEQAVDGKADTYWHSQYKPSNNVVLNQDDPTKNKNNNYYVELDAAYTVSEVTYLPRTENGQVTGNGCITKCNVYTSKDNGANWEKAEESGEWTYTGTDVKKTITFKQPVAGVTNIKFEVLSTKGVGGNDNKFINAAEFGIIGKKDAEKPPVSEDKAIKVPVLTAVAPVKGAKPANVTAADTEGYTVATAWTNSEGVAVTTFEAGKEYTLTATLKAAEGYKFTEDSKPSTIKIGENDVKVTADIKDAGKTMTLTCKFTVPADAVQYAKLTGLSGAADSVELTGETNGNGPAEKALDGKVDTYWHTNWNDSTKPKPESSNGKLSKNNTYTITLKKPSTVTEFTYMPRNHYANNGVIANGAITEGRVLVQTKDSTDWIEAGTISGWTYPNKDTTGAEENFKEKKVTFTQAHAGVTKVKVVVTQTAGSEANQHINAAEFGVIGKEDEGTPTESEGRKALANALEAAEAVEAEEKYTAESYAVYKTALEAANELKDKQDATEDALKAAAKALTDAIGNLKKKQEVPDENSTEIKAPKLSYTAPVTGESAKAPVYVAMADQSAKPATLEVKDGVPTTVGEDDGVWAFQGRLTAPNSGANNDKFDVSGDTPMVLRTKVKLNKKTTEVVNILGKMDEQYGIQVDGSANRVIFYCQDANSKWPEVEYKYDADKFWGAWHDIALVYTGTKIQLYVDGNAGTAVQGRPNAADNYDVKLKSYNSSVFTIGYNVAKDTNHGADANSKKYSTLDQVDGKIADIKLYKGTDYSAGMTKTYNEIKTALEKVTPDADISVVPYTAATTWTSEGKKLEDGEKFAAGKVYTVTTVYTARTGYKFTENSKPTVDGAKVTISSDGKTMTVTKTFGKTEEITCNCALSEITGVQDQTVELDVADSKSVKLKPTATATPCRVDGHDGKVVYTYKVKSAGKTGATVTEDGTVTVKDAGTAVITVTATLSRKGKEALVQKKDVTLTVKSNKASAAEKKELQDEVASVAGQIADKDNYTAESYQKLQDAVAEAKRLLNSGTASKKQIADAKAAIAAAKSGLITKTAAAKKKLGDLLDEVAKLDKKLYTAESYNAMVAADEAAVKAYNKADATEEELTKAYNALKAAQDKLVFKLDQAKKEAAKALEAAKAIYDAGQKDYDDASWKAFSDAYNALKNAGEKADAAALTTLIGALTKAQGALTVKKAETPKPEVKLAAPAVKEVKAKAAKGGVTVTVTVEPVKDAAAYDVYRVVKGKADKVGTTAAGKTAVTDTTAIRGASYYAVAVSADGKTVSEAGAAVAVKLAKAPKIKKASAGTKSVKLTWKKAKGTKVVVYRSTKKNSGYKKAATSRKGAASLVNKKVKAGKTYYYKIATVKGKTVSAMSKAKKVKIKK